MFLLRRPSPALIERVLAAERPAPLSYPDAGITRTGGARGYGVNRHELRLGAGAEVYARAVAAARSWAMYDLPWTHVVPPGTPAEPGAVFATVVHHLGFWSINPCRVVYVDEQETEEARTFAFAIGTLPRHSERGEERFTVEWKRADGSVRFEILSYAGARHWMARIGVRYVRVLQARFGRAALQAVRARVERG